MEMSLALKLHVFRCPWDSNKLKAAILSFVIDVPQYGFKCFMSCSKNPSIGNMLSRLWRFSRSKRSRFVDVRHFVLSPVPSSLLHSVSYLFIAVHVMVVTMFVCMCLDVYQSKDKRKFLSLYKNMAYAVKSMFGVNLRVALKELNYPHVAFYWVWTNRTKSQIGLLIKHLVSNIYHDTSANTYAGMNNWSILLKLLTRHSSCSVYMAEK